MGPFAGLVTDGQLGKVGAGIEAAVAASFLVEAQRRKVILVTSAPQATEMRRRTAICIKIFRELRGDLSWGVERILDNLPHFLQCELDGIPWTPTMNRATWCPETKIAGEDHTS